MTHFLPAGSFADGRGRRPGLFPCGSGPAVLFFLQMKTKTLAHLACAVHVCALAILIAGCATVPEPQEGRTLLVGRFEHRGSNYPVVADLDLNGTTRSGIMLTFRNLASRKAVTVTTRWEGYFDSVALPPGRYALEKVEVKLTGANGSWRNVYAMLPGDVTLRLEEGVVNNLGYLVWVTDGAGNTCQYYGNSKYDEVQTEYRDRLAKTGWNTFEYRETGVGSLNGW